MSRLAQVAAVRVHYVSGVTHGVRVMTEEPEYRTRLTCSVCGVSWDVQPGRMREDYTQDGAIVCTFDREHYCEACCDWRRTPHDCD